MAVGAQMRTNSAGPADLSQVCGQTTETEVCIRVYWEYLSYLAILLGLELLFFAAVLVVNHRSSWRADWKSSTLAVVFQDVSGRQNEERKDEQQQQPLLEMEADLVSEAKGIQVMFSEVGGQWQLRQEPDS